LSQAIKVGDWYFPVDPAARTTFRCVGLVGGARIEIEAIATV